MANSGIPWIDWAFNTAVRLLYALAHLVVCEKPGKRQFGLSSTLFGAFEIARK